MSYLFVPSPFPLSSSCPFQLSCLFPIRTFHHLYHPPLQGGCDNCRKTFGSGCGWLHRAQGKSKESQVSAFLLHRLLASWDWSSNLRIMGEAINQKYSSFDFDSCEHTMWATNLASHQETGPQSHLRRLWITPRTKASKPECQHPLTADSSTHLVSST